jgi:hypothetical protein
MRKYGLGKARRKCAVSNFRLLSRCRCSLLWRNGVGGIMVPRRHMDQYSPVTIGLIVRWVPNNSSATCMANRSGCRSRQQFPPTISRFMALDHLIDSRPLLARGLSPSGAIDLIGVKAVGTTASSVSCHRPRFSWQYWPGSAGSVKNRLARASTRDNIQAWSSSLPQ